jgi:hypothetical protein
MHNRSVSYKSNDYQTLHCRESVVFSLVITSRRSVARSCERSNEPSGSIKGGEFFACLSDC